MSKYLNNKHQLFIISEIKGLLIFHENEDEMPLKNRDVRVMDIVTYDWWFQEPDHIRMSCLR